MSADLSRRDVWLAAEHALIAAQLRSAVLEAERLRLEALLQQALLLAHQREREKERIEAETAHLKWGVHPLHPRLPLPLCVKVAAWLGPLRARLGRVLFGGMVASVLLVAACAVGVFAQSYARVDSWGVKSVCQADKLSPARASFCLRLVERELADLEIKTQKRRVQQPAPIVVAGEP